MTQKLIVRHVRNKLGLQETFKLRYRVYCAAPLDKRPSDFKPEDFPDGIEKDLWDDYSVHFAAFLDGEVVGTVRLIKGAECPEGFLMESAFVLPAELPRDKGLEASRMVVDPQVQRQGIRRQLDQTAMVWSIQNSYSWWCLAVQDYLLLSCYRAGWNIQEISGPTPYHDTTVYAIIVDLKKSMPSGLISKTP